MENEEIKTEVQEVVESQEVSVEESMVETPEVATEVVE
jgi:hypothetical protein